MLFIVIVCTTGEREEGDAGEAGAGVRRMVVMAPSPHQDRRGRARRRREEARSYECVRLAENVVEVFACEVERSPELID